MDPKQLDSITRLNCVLTALLVLAGLSFFERPVWLGFAVGGGLATINFWSIQKLIIGSMTKKGRTRVAMQALLMAKMGILMGLVFLCLRFLPMNPLAFAAGLSIFLLSIAIVSARFALTGSSREENGRA